MIEITNKTDYVFIKNIEDIYKIELFEDYYYNNENKKEYKIRIYCFNSSYDEYTYTISFNEHKRAIEEYNKMVGKIKEEYYKIIGE